MDFAGGRATTTLTLLGLTLAGTVFGSGCRERAKLCEDSDCSTLLRGGAAGDSDPELSGASAGVSASAADAEAGGASGGALEREPMDGGAAGASECSSDRDCDDGRACTGGEVCEAGRCSSIPVECAPATHCVEQPPNAFSCEFERAPHWLVYYADEIAKGTLLLAQPLEYLDDVPGLELARGVDLEGFPIGPDQFNPWSPNGRYLALVTGTGLLYLKLRLLLVEFGAGLPEPAHLAKGIPQRTDLIVEDWSLDSSRALVLNLSNQHEGYVVNAPANRTSLLFADSGGSDFLHFCADSRLVTRQYPDGIHLLDVETGSNTSVGLPDARGLTLSPDKRWLYFENAEGSWVTPCAANGIPQRLTPGGGNIEWVSWSADTKFLSLQLYLGEVSVFDVDAAFKRLAVFPGGDHSWTWSPNAHRLAGTQSDEADVATLFSVDFSSQAPSPRQLGPATNIVSDVTWVNDELLAYGAQAADGTYEAHLARAVEPFDDRIVTRFAPGVTFHSLQYDPLGRYLFFVQREEELEQVYALSLGSSKAKPQAVFDSPLQPDLTLQAFTSDGSGLVVQYRAPAPLQRGSLWWVAIDEHGIAAPRAINGGHNAAFATLKPGP